MFSINILYFMYNFSLKGDTLYQLISSGGIDLLIPPDSPMGDTISRDTSMNLVHVDSLASDFIRLFFFTSTLIWQTLYVLYHVCLLDGDGFHPASCRPVPPAIFGCSCWACPPRVSPKMVLRREPLPLLA